MDRIDIRLRINGRADLDVAQAVALVAIAARHAGEAAGLESNLDLGGLVVVTPEVPVEPPSVEPPAVVSPDPPPVKHTTRKHR